MTTIRRWIIFNSVGAIGIAVQMSALVMLTSGLGINYLAATALAVEAALINNFFWHERWTWSDRGPDGRWRRLAWFHLANGIVSMAGNLALMHVLVEGVGLNCLLANALSIAACSIINFVAGDRIVFARAASRATEGDTTMAARSSFMKGAALPLLLVAVIAPPAEAHAAELQPETIKAWNACVERTERRISRELASGEKFLALDFLDPAGARQRRETVLSGETQIRQIDPLVGCGVGDAVPHGMLHHWIGTVYLPGVTLEQVLSRIERPEPAEMRQEDVLEHRILESAEGKQRVFLKLQRSKLVTVVYNTEHLVRYQRHGNGKASSRSAATRIAEVERLDGAREREKPVGRDHGYLWRLNSYWRYQQVNGGVGGVIVECESMTLSRSIPRLLEYAVGPVIRSVARDSMDRTLVSLRSRISRSGE